MLLYICPNPQYAQYQVNCGLWLMMFYQCSFILGKNCTILVRDIDSGEGIHVWVGFPGGSVVENPPTNAGGMSSISGLVRSSG